MQINQDYNGYVVYCREKNRSRPYAVVGKDYERHAISDKIPESVKQYLIQIEDKRFQSHVGIDLHGIGRALYENVKAGKIVQGGSTITQQLARNLLRDNRKTLGRKLAESVEALRIEANYSKDEILDLYFNHVYFGNNIRGLRTAGLYYFGKEISHLTQTDLIALLTILRGPNYYLNNPAEIQKRFHFLSRKLSSSRHISKNRHRSNLRKRLQFKGYQLESFRSACIPFISDTSQSQDLVIHSTIDPKTQRFLNEFVKESAYPVSIVALKDTKVIGVASSYGSDYPFVSKTNVGSTLKPFLYCHVLENQAKPEIKYDAHSNDLNWPVREIGHYGFHLTIEEALIHSNNNAFINACNTCGLDDSLRFLAEVLDKPREFLVPSSILGATVDGVSLYEIGSAYAKFFNTKCLTESKIKCLDVLRTIALNKFGITAEGVFLKTGTTNDNKERFAILGDSNTTFAILRNENLLNDYSKEGSFIKQVSNLVRSYFKPKTDYKWQ